MSNLDKIKGAIYGAAIGDALGAPLEFMPAEQIKQQFGEVKDMLGGGWLQVAPGEGTDETALLLAVAFGIIKDKEDPYANIGENYIRWAISHPRDIGDTTLCSIDRTMAKGHGKHRIPRARWQESAAQVDVFSNRGSVDNGAIINCLYPALCYTSMGEAVEKALNIANMTHVNTQSDNACRLYTQLIYRIVHENIDKATVEEMIDNTMYYDYKQDIIQPTASANDSTVAMLRAFMETESAEEALIRAINFGGDSDTIGAMVGGLAGAYYGYESIPTRWVESLPEVLRESLDIIVNFAKD